MGKVVCRTCALRVDVPCVQLAPLLPALSQMRAAASTAPVSKFAGPVTPTMPPMDYSTYDFCSWAGQSFQWYDMTHQSLCVRCHDVLLLDDRVLELQLLVSGAQHRVLEAACKLTMHLLSLLA